MPRVSYLRDSQKKSQTWYTHVNIQSTLPHVEYILSKNNQTSSSGLEKYRGREIFVGYIYSYIYAHK